MLQDRVPVLSKCKSVYMGEIFSLRMSKQKINLLRVHIDRDTHGSHQLKDNDEQMTKRKVYEWKLVFIRMRIRARSHSSKKLFALCLRLLS